MQPLVLHTFLVAGSCDGGSHYVTSSRRQIQKYFDDCSSVSVRHGNACLGRARAVGTPANEYAIIAAMERELLYITGTETIPKYDPQKY